VYEPPSLGVKFDDENSSPIQRKEENNEEYSKTESPVKEEG